MLCFTFTELRFASEMAVLLVIWMLTSAAASLIVLPPLLLVVRPRFMTGDDSAVLLRRCVRISDGRTLPTSRNHPTISPSPARGRGSFAFADLLLSNLPHREVE